MSPTDRIRCAFFGTPHIAVAALQALWSDPRIDVVAVVTNPDRPRGRSRTPVAPPVKAAAADHDLPVLQPRKPREALDDLAALDLDVCAVVAYGAILPKDLLDVSRHGFVNLHFSLLPRWRGAAPVQHAIRRGDEVTGVTTFVLDEGMDTGPVLRQEEVPVGTEETTGSLLDRLAAVGAPLLVESIIGLVDGDVPTPQDDRRASYAPKVTPEDVAIDWTASATDVANLVRSANPAPGAHTTWQGERFKVWRAVPVTYHGEPGSILSADRDGLVVATGDDAVRLDEVQPAGKGRMQGVAFANGYQPRPGERFGE